MAEKLKQSAGAIARKYHKKQQREKNRIPRAKYAKTPFEYQLEVSECGAASLSMIMQYYGKYVPLEELRVETGVSRNGVNAKNICIAAENYGLEAVGSRRSLDDMVSKNTMPCIIHWNFSHFVVFEGMKGKKYFINDPQRGRRKLTRQEMLEGYSGTVLQMTPTERFVKARKKRSVSTFLRERLEGQTATMVSLFLLGIALILPGILNPVFTQTFMDDILIYDRKSWLKFIILGMILTTAYDAYFTYIRSRISLMLRIKSTLLSSDRMIAHMFRLPIDFFEQRYAGDLMSRVNNNASVAHFLTGEVVNVLVSLVTSMAYLIMMMLYSIKLSGIGVFFSVLSVTIAVLISKKMMNLTIKFSIDNGKLYGALYNGLSANASLKAVGAENIYTSRVLGYYAEVNYNDQYMGRLQTVLDVIPNTLKSINTVLILIAGSQLVIDGVFTPGMIMAFSGFLGSFSSPFVDIVSFARGLQQVKSDMLRVEDIMNYKEDANYTAEKAEIALTEKLRGEINMENISFAYGKLDAPLVKNFSFHVKSGNTVALVGSSGCGKSTVSKILCGLFKPWTGEVSFDDMKVENIPTEVFFSSVAMVTQAISLFDGSVYDNITTWNKTIKQEDVIQAAKDACLHDEITTKPGGYDYQLKENGSNLSGGQRQRLEIAKALATNPTILILDEATSALDVTTEKKILDNIKRRHCTCVIIAQRLSTIRDSDEIIVMDRGRIKERGTHEELLKKQGLYRKLVAEAD